uniref:Uncharacterized protein n=1 Tax=Salix viminalis TaxID=40686 RepID=A0A6N2MDR1_SALVM
MAFSSQSVMHAVLCECLKKLWQNTLKAVFSSGNGSSILFSYVGVSVLFWFGCAILTVMCGDSFLPCLQGDLIMEFERACFKVHVCDIEFLVDWPC